MCSHTHTKGSKIRQKALARTWRMNSALALRSSGVAMATKRSRLSSPSAMYAQRRIDRMHLAAAMPLFATRILRIGRLPPWLCPTKFQPRPSLQSSAARAREASLPVRIVLSCRLVWPQPNHWLRTTTACAGSRRSHETQNEAGKGLQCKQTRRAGVSSLRHRSQLFTQTRPFDEAKGNEACRVRL